MSIPRISAELSQHGLFVMGALHDAEETVLLAGAAPEMWPVFQSSPEYKDATPDPLDRWSKRILTPIANAAGGHALFPSDGPPYLPFIAWAKATGQFWDSPTGMMVHTRAGLMISIRGALRLPGKLDLPSAHATSPCLDCSDKPCQTACPVGALSALSLYDVPTCKSHIAQSAGLECLEGGCLVRRACPVSTGFGREPAQSGFHMRAFMRM